MARADAEGARERRVVAGGAIVLALAFVFTYAVVPFARHWQAREATLTAIRARVTYLRDVANRTEAIEAAAAEVERALSVQPRRVLHARSSTLAANSLQTFLQDAADASHLAVTRVEVSPDDSARGNQTAPGGTEPLDAVVAGLTQLPATFSAYGDIAGVAALMDFLTNGPRVLGLERVSLLRNSALAGAPDVVQVTLLLRAPVLPP